MKLFLPSILNVALLAGLFCNESLGQTITPTPEELMLFSEIEFLVEDWDGELAIPPELFVAEAPGFTEELIDEGIYFSEENPIITTILAGSLIAAGIYAVDEGLIEKVDMGTIKLGKFNFGGVNLVPTISPTIDLKDPEDSTIDLYFNFKY